VSPGIYSPARAGSCLLNAKNTINNPAIANIENKTIGQTVEEGNA
jgi:hypothetical protein